MIKIYQIDCNAFLIWNSNSIPLLKSYRITFEELGKNNDVPIRLSFEKAELLVKHLKVASYFKALYQVPKQIELRNHANLYDFKLQEWRKEKTAYESKMRAKYVHKEILNEIPDKPLLPVSVETTNEDQSWCQDMESNLANSNYPHDKLNMLHIKYRVFLALWQDGWWIGEGNKFGGDFLLYQDHPESCHSSYIVSIIFNNNQNMITYRDLMCSSRLANVTKKTLVYCFWDHIRHQVKFICSDWSGWN